LIPAFEGTRTLVRSPALPEEVGIVDSGERTHRKARAFRMNWLVFLEEWARATLRDPKQHFTRRKRRHCSVCGFHGLFIRAGRVDARCPNCSSRERDRLVGHYLTRKRIDVRGKRVLHLSPERCFWRQWRSGPNYVSGDVKKNKVANTFIDVTRIQFPNEYFDYVFCNHILEHVVEDRQGMRECFRVLKPGGLAVFSVPLFENGRTTFEPPPSMSKRDVERICGWDHKRIYGFDFLDRLHEAGFETAEITCSPEEAAHFRMTHDEIGAVGSHRVFVAWKARIIGSRPHAGAARHIGGLEQDLCLVAGPNEL
jgi:SAM-dependent methyltransferase